MILFSIATLQVISVFAGIGIKDWSRDGVDNKAKLLAQAHTPFVISPSQLVRCGCPATSLTSVSRRGRRFAADWCYRGNPCGLGKLLLPGSEGKLVHIVKIRLMHIAVNIGE